MAGMKLVRKIAVVQTAISSKKEARELAALILEKHLGACIQISPVKSFYRWRGKTEAAGEFLVAVKTTLGLAARLAAFIKKNHSYELPEIIITKTDAHHDYARWVAGETKHTKRANP